MIEDESILPCITITVAANPDMDAVAQVTELIEALPSPEEFSRLLTSFPASTDPEYGDWLDSLNRQKQAVNKAYTAFHALTVAEKEAVATELTDKLDRLYDIQIRSMLRSTQPNSNVVEVTLSGQTPQSYASFGDAWDIAYNRAGAKIKLLSDITWDGDTLFIEEENIVLDLNGHILSSNTPYSFLSVTESGKLTVSDSRKGGGIISSGTVLYVSNNGAVIIDGAKLESTQGKALNTSGTADVKNNAEIRSNSTYAIYNTGTLNISSGTIRGSSFSIYSFKGTVNISGGTIGDVSECNYGVFNEVNSTLNITGTPALAGRIAEFSTSTSLDANGYNGAPCTIKWNGINDPDTVVAKNCTDVSKFSVINEGYHLESNGTNLVLKAGTGYTLSVNGSYAPASGAGVYPKDKVITIHAGTRANYRFNGWTTEDGGSFADASMETTTYTMPETDAAVTAAWVFTGSSDHNSSTNTSSGNSGSDDSNYDIGLPISTAPAVTAPGTVKTADGGTLTTATTTSAAGDIVNTRIQRNAAGQTTGASADVTPGQPSASVRDGQASVGIQVDPASIAQAAQTAGTQMHVNIHLPSELIQEQLLNPDVRTVNMDLQIPSAITGNPGTPVSGITLDRETLEAAKAAGKNLFITITNEQGLVHCHWTFDSQGPAASGWSGASVNLAINAVPVKLLPDSKEEIQHVVVNTTNIPANTVPGLSLGFGHSGALPAPAQVRIPTFNDSGIKPGDTVYLYSYDPLTKTLEALDSNRYTVDSGGYVIIRLDHGTEYVLLPATALAP